MADILQFKVTLKTPPNKKPAVACPFCGSRNIEIIRHFEDEFQKTVMAGCYACEEFFVIQQRPQDRA